MINEDRVKEMYRMAVYDEYEEKQCHQAGEYTLWDYVGKELVKSFFSGTIVFVLVLVFVSLGDLDRVTRWINKVDLTKLLPKVCLVYAGFMALYFLATILVYCVRYAQGYQKIRSYARHLKKARRLLRREEK